MFWILLRIFAVSFVLIGISLYCDAFWFTPMPDNDSELAAWGMRYALIPAPAFLYAIMTSIFTLPTKAVITKIGFLRKASETGFRLPPAWFRKCLTN